MAHKRMFSKDITGSDAFREMPTSTQALYFHLGMDADDDGFLDNYRGLMRSINSSDDDLKILLAKRFLILFPSKVIVVKHWKINNTIQKDRYHETKHLEEKRALIIKENGAYTELDTKRIQSVSKLETQNRIGKDRIEKKRTDSAQSADAVGAIETKATNETFDVFWTTYPRKTAKAEALKSWSKLKPDEPLILAILKALELQKQSSQWRRDAGQYIPHPATWLNQRRWEDEASTTITKINRYG
jgi:hypothetical protein